jgi:hypothetical protein
MVFKAPGGWSWILFDFGRERSLSLLFFVFTDQRSAPPRFTAGGSSSCTCAGMVQTCSILMSEVIDTH